MYSKDEVLPAVRSDEQLNAPHPVYMGLIKQIDDQLGELWQFLEEQRRFDDTMIVFTSDHGDYLGDHWLGEKDLFHDASVKVPMIIYDPQIEANQTRGTVCDALVESIDLLPTFLEFVGGKVPKHRLEGRSLGSWLHTPSNDDWREYVISEYDYAQLRAGAKLDVEPIDARLFMVMDKQYKYIHALGFRPMLFDLQSDPDELIDLGESTDHQAICRRMLGALHEWALRNSQRTTISDEKIEQNRGGSASRGILIGVKGGDELSDDVRRCLE